MSSSARERLVGMTLLLDAVQLDTSIQCRAAIDTAVVNEYAERMRAGDTFPPVEVYGSKSKCWIGDGWHRTLAALQCGTESIAAKLHPGGRVDALKHALGANALHGHRRSNADKRRCVEIALREFPKLSSRAVAKMCGVSDPFVSGLRPALQTVSDAPATVTTSDGRQYPAKREPLTPAEADRLAQLEATIQAGLDRFPGLADPSPLRKIGPPRDGLEFARIAIMNLEQIREDDVERSAAFECVRAWISDHWEKG